MSKQLLGVLFFVVVAASLLAPDSAWAVVASGFESKMNRLTNQLISVMLPLMSVLGLLYAVFLAVIGDASAKVRILTVIGCSIVGFLAPHIIAWLQSIAG